MSTCLGGLILLSPIQTLRQRTCSVLQPFDRIWKGVKLRKHTFRKGSWATDLALRISTLLDREEVVALSTALLKKRLQSHLGLHRLLSGITLAFPPTTHPAHLLKLPMLSELAHHEA